MALEIETGTNDLKGTGDQIPDSGDEQSDARFQGGNAIQTVESRMYHQSLDVSHDHGG